VSLAINEEWRPIPGYQGRYEVSDRGRVMSHQRQTPRLLKSFVHRDGYPCVNLGRGNQRYVHRLVLEAFVGSAPEGMEACHDNGDRADCRLANLRWDHHSGNMLDKVRHGTHHEASKTHCPQNHPYSAENTYIEPATGKRNCRSCRRERMSKYPPKSQRSTARRRQARTSP
jgi:hypothetical protein